MNRASRLGLSAPDLTFAAVLIMALGSGGKLFLSDPGVFWHLQLGQEIRETGAAPTVDTLSAPRADQPWVDQSWLFDLGLATIVDHVGWAGAVLAASLVLALAYALLCSDLIARRRSPLAAVAASVLAAGVGAIHWHARPHLFTILGVVILLSACRRYRETGNRSFFLVVPFVMIPWANLHGGFLAGPFVIACSAVGQALYGLGGDSGRKALGFGAAAAIAAAASLVNPYGFGLYEHVFGLLGDRGLTDWIEEYESIPFGEPIARNYEIILLCLVALPVFSRLRPSWFDLVHVIAWLHLSLGTIRHAPLFAIAAAPVLAILGDGLVPDRERVEPIRPVDRPTFRSLIFAAVASAAVAFGAPVDRFDPARWPFAGLTVLNQQDPEARLFHEQNWGGLIAAKSDPRRPVFIDDRFELYGEPMIRAYGQALHGGPAWDRLDEEYAFELVWLRPDRGLAERLESEDAWEELHRSGVSVLFRRRDGRQAP